MPSEPSPVQALLDAASRIAGVSPDRANGRTTDAFLVRQAVALVLSRQGWTHSRIAQELHRERSTVSSAVQRGERQLSTDPTLARLVADLEAGVREPVSISARMEALEARIAELESLLAPHRRTA